MTLTRKLAFGSIAVSLIVLLIKGIAYEVTGSVALFSDALESTINVVSSITALMAIGFAAQPPDAEHPYGHGKAEYLSAVAIGVMIVLAGVAILREAYAGIHRARSDRRAFARPRHQQHRHGHECGVEHRADPDGTAGALSGAGFGRQAFAGRCGDVSRRRHRRRPGGFPGILVLDSIIAALVACHVLWSGWDVIRENSGGLLDEAAPADEIERIKEIIAANSEEAIETHAVRTRLAGKTTFVDFDLVVSRRDDGVPVARDLRPVGGGAQGRSRRGHRDHPRRARRQGRTYPHVSSDQTGASI